MEDVGRMSQRLTWRDGPASKTEGAIVQKLQKSQSDGAQGPKERAGQEKIQEIGMQDIIEFWKKVVYFKTSGKHGFKQGSNKI